MRFVKQYVEMTEEEYHAMNDASEGICLACGATASQVEPDAHHYTCESCGEEQVYGIEELAIMEKLRLT